MELGGVLSALAGDDSDYGHPVSQPIEEVRALYRIAKANEVVLKDIEKAMEKFHTWEQLDGVERALKERVIFHFPRQL